MNEDRGGGLIIMKTNEKNQSSAEHVPIKSYIGRHVTLQCAYYNDTTRFQKQTVIEVTA